MSVSPNVLQQAVVTFADPRQGSCLTKELLAELKSLMRIEIVDAGVSAEMKASSDPNNLSTVAGDGGIFTQAGLFHQETKTFTGTNLTFTGWSSAIDAQTCLLSAFAIYSEDETGVAVQGDPSGTEHIRPTLEIISITSTTVVLRIHNNSEDCSVTLQLWQPATPVT